MFVKTVLLLSFATVLFSGLSFCNTVCQSMMEERFLGYVWPGDSESLNNLCSHITVESQNDFLGTASTVGCSEVEIEAAIGIFGAYFGLCRQDNQRILTGNFDCLDTKKESIRQGQDNCWNQFSNGNFSKLEAYRVCMVQPMKNCCPDLCPIYDLYIALIQPVMPYVQSHGHLPHTLDEAFCGKTVICNFLADATEVSGGEYRPTQGVRILEFEVNGLSVPGRSSVDVELWDCSGDNKFEACWPAITQDAMGVIFVYNPDQPNHDQDLEKWYKFFGTQKSMKVNGCVVFEHHRPNASEVVRTELPAGFTKMPRISTNIEDDPEAVRTGFNRFLEMIIAAISRHREKEELNIMNQ